MGWLTTPRRRHGDCWFSSMAGRANRGGSRLSSAGRFYFNHSSIISLTARSGIVPSAAWQALCSTMPYTPWLRAPPGFSAGALHFGLSRVNIAPGCHAPSLPLVTLRKSAQSHPSCLALTAVDEPQGVARIHWPPGLLAGSERWLARISERSVASSLSIRAIRCREPQFKSGRSRRQEASPLGL
jgi:hypothetical protein